jgi:hypothetical protein
MKITPFGKMRTDEIIIAQSFFDSDSDVAEKNTLEDVQPQDDANKIQEMIRETVGKPSLDNLVTILESIGMSDISLKKSADGTVLSVSGVIRLSEDSKIRKG